MKKILAAFAFILGTSSLAHAGMMIEPYLGYEFSDLKYQFIGQSEYTDKLSGTGLGLRLGYKMLLPWFALDYTTVSGKGKTDYPGSANYDYTRSSLGAVVGVDLPLIRGWIGYGFSNDYTQKGEGLVQDRKFKGTYTKLGVGLGILPFVSLNAEYQMNDLKKVDFGTGEQDKSDVFTSTKNDSIMLSVSIPFNL
jgi:hypothetical protein